MKKIIGILGIAVIAAAMFLNTNAVSDSSLNSNLASIITLNSANAEEITIGSTDCTCKETTCQDANWISFRTNCGNVGGTSTDSACEIVHPDACN